MKKTEYYPLAKERNGMQKLQFREYKNKTIKSQKEKYKNFTNKHYYGFDHKSLSVHMNLGWYTKSTKKFFFQLKPDSDRVLTPDSVYRSQSGQFGR